MIPATLAADLADGMDVDGFAARCGFPALDPWQRAILDSAAPRHLVAVTRQGGKSQTAALVAIRAMLARRDVLVVALAHRLPAAGELKRKVAHAYRRLGEPVPVVGDAALSFELASGSRFVCVPGSDAGGRSWSAPAVLIIDEAARVPTDAIEAALPTQATVAGARCLVLSTPRGRVNADGTDNWFAREWHGPPEAWARTRVPAADCPRIAAAWLATERARLGPLLYAAEYEVSFDGGDGDGGAIDPALLRRCVSPHVRPLFADAPLPARAPREAVPA